MFMRHPRTAEMCWLHNVFSDLQHRTELGDKCSEGILRRARAPGGGGGGGAQEGDMYAGSEMRGGVGNASSPADSALS